LRLTKKRKLSYGSSGIGTPGHLAAEMLRSYGAQDLQHVPYKGARRPQSTSWPATSNSCSTTCRNWCRS